MLWLKVSSLKLVCKQSVLVDRQLYGSEFQTEGKLRLNDFDDIVRDIRGIVSTSLLEDRNVLVGM